MTDWRVIQIFMGSAEDRVQVFEVSYRVGHKPRQFRCSCPGWRMRHHCKHIDYVIEQTGDDVGYAPPLATSEGREPLTAEIMANPELFRQWIYTNVFVVVVP